MQDMILLKQGEIVLKGLNRSFFEQKLISNTARRLRKYGKFRIYSTQSTVYVEPQSDDCDMDGAFATCAKTFGVAALSRAVACPKDPDAIFAAAKEYLRDDMLSARSFKVETRRADKRYHMTSIQLSQYVGGLLSDEFPDIAVDVHNPELVVNIEIRDYAAYVHATATPGPGGMPVGSNGRVISLLSGGIDSPVSTWLAARRGLQIIPVHFYSFPYTSELARQKVIDLADKLSDWTGPLSVEMVSATEVQEEIRDKCPEEYATVILRRFMMRCAGQLALDNGCKGIITGESLGQVASQTMEAMAATEACSPVPVFRPLICSDKREIVELARKIDTYDLSVLPYEDCCTVFTPRHPRTKPRIEDVEAAEAALDMDALVQRALETRERVAVRR